MCAHNLAFVAFLGFKVHTHSHSTAYVSASRKGNLKRKKTLSKTHRCKRLLKTINDTLDEPTDPKNFRL